MRKFDHPLPISTFTMRHTSNKFALPVRSTRRASRSSQWAMESVEWLNTTLQGWPLFTVVVRDRTRRRQASIGHFLTNIEPHADVQVRRCRTRNTSLYYEQWEQGVGRHRDKQRSPDPGIDELSDATTSRHCGRDGVGIRTEALGYHPYPGPTALRLSGLRESVRVQVNASYTGMVWRRELRLRSRSQGQFRL